METVNRSIAVSINSSRPVAVFLGDYIELYCNHNAIDGGVVSYSWEHLDNLTKLSEDSIKKENSKLNYMVFVDLFCSYG